jgi:hypothetical protein
MTNKKITIITCFSYIGNKKYFFNPQYLRSDLRRIISFSHNRIGCSLENTYVITDLHPSKELQDEILNDFCTEVIDYFRELQLLYGHYDLPSTDYLRNIHPLKWLYDLCKQLVPDGKVDDLYDIITNTILPIVRSSNVVEFVSLFTNFTLITGRTHFDETLAYLFSQPMTNLFFYYTGHGVRLCSDSAYTSACATVRSSSNKRTYQICLVIPGLCSSAEFYSCHDLQKRFTPIIGKISSFIVFDCCHAETILEFPYKVTFSNKSDDLYISNYVNENKQLDSIYLSSTRNKQTCGFYVSDINHYGGSLFTYYLIHFLDNIGSKILSKNYNTQRRDLLELSRLREVEEKVQKYRKLAEKKPQNISIGLSHDSITHFPIWLFNNSSNHQFQLVEQDD